MATKVFSKCNYITEDVLEAIDEARKINAFELPRIPKKFDTKVGVYFLFKNDVVVYVGQSRDIDRRIWHHEKNKDFDSYAYLLCDAEMISFYERMLINKYKPIYNNDSVTKKLKRNDR